MDQFPESFNRATCLDIMEKCQADLLRTIRKEFFDKITTSVQECSTYVVLEFPDKLWNEHRVTLIKELLHKFGKMRVEIEPGKTVKHNLKKELTITDSIPENIKQITIDFVKSG
jgi:hypothetical protein